MMTRHERFEMKIQRKYLSTNDVTLIWILIFTLFFSPFWIMEFLWIKIVSQIMRINVCLISWTKCYQKTKGWTWLGKAILFHNAHYWITFFVIIISPNWLNSKYFIKIVDIIFFCCCCCCYRRTSIFTDITVDWPSRLMYFIVKSSFCSFLLLSQYHLDCCIS